MRVVRSAGGMQRSAGGIHMTTKPIPLLSREMTACPQAFYPPITAQDGLGTFPYLNCSSPRAEDFQNNAFDIFNVSVCRNDRMLMLRVIHLQGFVDSDANRAYSTGPDFITSQLVGPELKLVSAQEHSCDFVSIVHEVRQSLAFPKIYRSF